MLSHLLSCCLRTAWACRLILPVLGFAPVVFAGDVALEKEENNIREAAFRFQFGHYATGEQKSAKVYFLACGESKPDPSDEFMSRFAGHTPPVSKLSACEANAIKGVHDKKTGEQGVVFTVSYFINWDSTNTAFVTGTYYSGRSFSENSFYLKKENGNWKVTNEDVRWVMGGGLRPIIPDIVYWCSGMLAAIPLTALICRYRRARNSKNSYKSMLLGACCASVLTWFCLDGRIVFTPAFWVWLASGAESKGSWVDWIAFSVGTTTAFAVLPALGVVIYYQTKTRKQL